MAYSSRADYLPSNTARRWISVLEASYVVFRLPALHASVRQRLVKTPKLYFYDTGLLCYLLGIRTPEQIEVHPLRGAVFETWVVSEILKFHLHRGETPNLSFYRDRKGHEIDLIVDRGSHLIAVEVKAGRTAPADAFDALQRFDAATAQARIHRHVVVYAGEVSQRRSRGDLLSWRAIDTHEWREMG